jgi:uncharacterized protein
MSVCRLYYYPIKGLSPQPLERVELAVGRGFPFDRMFGLARAGSGFDPLHPVPLPKQRFFMLARDARLAELHTHLDPQTLRFTIHVHGKMAHESDLSSEAGAAAAEDFFSRLFNLAETSRPVLARADPHRFTDVSVDSPQMMQAISMINLASVEDFASRIGQPVDPLRFRANLYFDGFPPWSELEMVGQELRIGGVKVRILKRIERCAATEVNLQTAQRDIAVPRLIKQHYGHTDMGIYGEVLTSGTISVGDEVAA